VTYALDENELGFEAVTLTFTAGAPDAQFWLGTQLGGYPQPLMVGLDGRFHITQDDDGENWAVRGAWDGDEFKLTIKTMRHPWNDDYQFKFDAEAITVSVQDNVNGGSWLVSGAAQ
jgi:hypothetical protein